MLLVKLMVSELMKYMVINEREMPLKTPQQKRDVADGGPTLNQHWLNVCLVVCFMKSCERQLCVPRTIEFTSLSVHPGEFAIKGMPWYPPRDRIMHNTSCSSVNSWTLNSFKSWHAQPWWHTYSPSVTYDTEEESSSIIRNIYKKKKISVAYVLTLPCRVCRV